MDSTNVKIAQASPELTSEWRQLLLADSSDAYYAAWLAVLCSQLPDIKQGVLILGTEEDNTYAPVAIWPVKSQPSVALVNAVEQVLSTACQVSAEVGLNWLMAVPVLIDQQLLGVFAVETAKVDTDRQAAILQWMLVGLFAIEAAFCNQHSAEEQLTRERLIATLDLVASVLSESDFVRAARAVATDLATRLECDRVSIGFVRRQVTEVIAVSHSAEIAPRMNLVRAVGRAMDEAIDQKSILVFPTPVASLLVSRDHAQLARQYGNGNLLTLPFVVGDGQRGAFCFERPDAQAFDSHSIELCQSVVAIVARILEDKRRNDRGLIRRVADSVRLQTRHLLGPRYFGRKLMALVFVFCIVFFSFATGDYRIGATANLEGAVRRVMVAPFDGYVATSNQRAGDIVAGNVVLASLDDSDIRLEYQRWSSQRRQYERQYEQARAGHDRAQALIALAQMQQAEAQMNLMAIQLQRAQIVAPFAGLVVSGDLSQSLGHAVKRGQVLFEVSPLSAYRVVLEVADGDVANVAMGQTGNLILSALPGHVFPFQVTHLTPIVMAKDGRSYFRVEAMLQRQSPELRPGMQGIAKIDIGQRKLFWIATHRLFDWLRLSVWSWM